MWVQSLGWEDPLESMATHSGILAWRIPTDRGAWQATVHRVTKSQKQLKWLSMHAYYIPSTYLYYNWKFVSFGYLHSIPLISIPTPTSGKHKSDLFSMSLLLKYSLPTTICQFLVHIMTQYYFKIIITVNLVAICQHTKMLHHYWLYSPYFTFHPRDSFIL